MQAVNLSKLTSELQDHKLIGRPDVEVRGIEYASRKIKEGDLYVCIKGASHDGHTFAEEAVAKGATSLLVSSPVDGLDVPQIVVADTRKAMGILSGRFYGNPSERLKMVGITGTNGKTTTSFMVASIAGEAGKTGIIGTLGIYVDNEKTYEGRTTPESADIQKALQAMVSGGVEYCVSEISSHAIVQGRHIGCKFDALVFTNLTQDHLDYHRTMESYKLAKAGLFNDSSIQKTGTSIIYNADDNNWKQIVGEREDGHISFGLSSECDISGSILKAELDGSLVRINNSLNGTSYELKVKIPGIFNIYNALAAISVAHSLGFDNKAIKCGLEKLEHVPGRTETLHSAKGFSVVVDYAHTPDGLAKVLGSLKHCTKGRIITVFGCGGDRDKTKRPLMGQVVDEMSDIAIVTSDNPRTEDPRSIADDTVAGMKKEYHLILDRKEAIEKAVSMAKTEDCVLIAGKGHETYQEINGQQIYFNDTAVVLEILRTS